MNIFISTKSAALIKITYYNITQDTNANHTLGTLKKETNTSHATSIKNPLNKTVALWVLRRYRTLLITITGFS